MHNILSLARERVRQSIERERAIEHHFEAASRSLWPWRESFLLALVSFLAVLDYISTYAFLRFSGNRHLLEGGPLASWALRRGGFPALFWVDVAAIGMLVILAITARRLYTRFGFPGFGRTAFVLALVPYVVIAMAVVFNNIVVTFL